MFPKLAANKLRKARRNATAERRFESDDTIRKRRLMKGVGFVAILSVGMGAAMAFTEEKGEVVEMTANGGTATVREINRTLSEQHVIGFKTEVDGATAERKITNRTLVEKVPVLNALPLVKEIPAPDIIANVKINHFYVNSSLCFDGGQKTLKQYEVNGVKNVDFVVDPADIRVCSAQDVMKQPEVQTSGNWIDNINAASAELNKAFGGDGAQNLESVKEANAVTEEVRQLAVNAIYKTVNSKCGPLVFDATSKDIKELIAADIRRDGEVVNVTFKEGAGHDFVGNSDVDAFFEQKKKEETANIKWNFDGGIAGTCTLAKDIKDTGSHNG